MRHTLTHTCALALAVGLVLVGIGCGSDSASGTSPSPATGGAAGTGGSGGTAGTGGTGGAAGLGGAGGEGGTAGAGGTATAEVTVLLSATTSTYPHNDSLSGQTAQPISAGIRSLELIDDSGASWHLHYASPGATEVGYNDGDQTVLARLPLGDVRPGHYVRGRLVQDWSRFEVSATLHDLVGATAGTLRALHVSSEGALINGTPQPAGHYEHEFEAPGVLETYTGDDWAVPEHSQTAEAEAHVENGAWAVYFPMDLTIASAEIATLEVEVNMDHAFRWTDVPGLGNLPDVFDIAPPLYEPVEQFGGNRFTVTWSPAP